MLPLTLGPPRLRMLLPAPDAAGCCTMTSTWPSIEGELSTTPRWPRGSLTQLGAEGGVCVTWTISTTSRLERSPWIPRALPRDAQPATFSVCSDKDTWSSTMSPGERHRPTSSSVSWPPRSADEGTCSSVEISWGSLGNVLSFSNPLS